MSKKQKTGNGKKGTSATGRDAVDRLIEVYSPKTLEVLFELPNRIGSLPKDNIYDRAFVVDERNVGKVLGNKIAVACYNK